MNVITIVEHNIYYGISNHGIADNMRNLENIKDLWIEVHPHWIGTVVGWTLQVRSVEYLGVRTRNGDSPREERIDLMFVPDDSRLINCLPVQP